jgi:hypothetical protein
MKSRSLFLMIALMLSSISSAFEISFLKTEEFKKLSQEKKIQYLNGLQKIMVGMSKVSPYMADADQQVDSRRPAKKDDFGGWAISPPSAATDPVVQLALAAAPVPAPKVSAPAAPELVAKPAQKAIIPPTPKVVVSDSQFRCMHSGFVIEKDPCRGYQKIPDWMGIDGLSENNKSCGPGFSVCNPVIFGLKLSTGCNSFLQDGCSQKAKPFCAQSTLWPTEECYKMATNNGNRGTIVAAQIRSEVKPQLFERFEQQFNSLCNPENIKKNPHAEMKNGKKRSDKSAQAVRDDISKTCDWAQKQTNLLNESFAGITASKNRDALNRSEKGSK